MNTVFPNRYVYLYCTGTIVIANWNIHFHLLIRKECVQVKPYFCKLIKNFLGLRTIVFVCGLMVLKTALFYNKDCNTKSKNDISKCLFSEYYNSLQSAVQWTCKIMLQCKRDTKHDECLNRKANKALWRTNNSNCIAIFNRGIPSLSSQESSLGV